MKKRLVSFLPVVLSLLLSAGTASVFSACGMKEDGSWMRCHMAQEAVVYGGLVLAAVFFVAACLRQSRFRILLSVAGALGAVVVFFFPGPIYPLCMMETMRCHTVMQPFVRMMTVVIALSGVVSAWFAFREKQSS